jgi:glycosyltransferase involved in cell wall biosynthesis
VPSVPSNQRISCTIIAFNEADRIRRCIESVCGLADEVLLVDSGSTDGTREIAAELGARVIERPWTGYGPQKRFAQDEAAHDWILNLDADEWLSDEVRAEIREAFGRPVPKHVHGFRFRIRTVYPGAGRPRPFSDYHNYIRLYDRRRCGFPDSLVFDEVKAPKANVVQVRAPIYHETIRSLSHLWEKNIGYFQLQGQEIKKPRLTSGLRAPFEGLGVFLKYYIGRRHITGGAFGFRFAVTIAALRTYRIVHLAFGARKPKGSPRVDASGPDR